MGLTRVRARIALVTNTFCLACCRMSRIFSMLQFTLQGEQLALLENDHLGKQVGIQRLLEELHGAVFMADVEQALHLAKGYFFTSSAVSKSGSPISDWIRSVTMLPAPARWMEWICPFTGEIVGVVGESGSGKSVMSQSILRLREYETSVRYEAVSALRERIFCSCSFRSAAHPG